MIRICDSRIPAAAALVLAATLGATERNAAVAADGYERAGWIAHIMPGLHDVQGLATIIDERTIFVQNFTYDGAAPAVYFYLGESNTHEGFVNGLQLEPLLDRPYDNESLTLTLPEGETLDGYVAISVWCAAFNVNFGSAEFVEPPLGDMNCDGVVNSYDIDGFVLAIGDAEAYATAYPLCDILNGDANGDGVVNAYDIDGFIMLVGGG